MSAVKVDVGGILARLERCKNEISGGAVRALKEAADATLRAAQASTAFENRTGELRGKIRVGTGRMVTFVEARARHAGWIENGTGIYGPRGTPIVPTTKQFLRFRGRGGGWVFARSVKGTRATHFMAKAQGVGADVLTRQSGQYTSDAIRRFNG